MRFVPLNCLRPGQRLAIDLALDENRVFLRRGVSLTPLYIQRIRALGFQGAYIDDALSKDIHIAGVISDHLRMAVKKELRHVFLQAGKSPNTKADLFIGGLDGTIVDMVGEISASKNLLVNLVDLRTYDDYTFNHSMNVAVIASIIGAALGLSHGEMKDLALGAILHDIGKVFIDKDIINKPTALSCEESAVMQRHSDLGYDYLRSSALVSERAKLVSLCHHEYFAGEGYPFGLSGEDLPLFARIVSVADVFDALTSDRPYRGAFAPHEAFEYIMSHCGTMFDPDIVEAFTRKIAPYPAGTCVKLSNGMEGIVVENYEAYSLRPRVRVLHERALTDEYIDLAHDRSALCITIGGIIHP